MCVYGAGDGENEVEKDGGKTERERERENVCIGQSEKKRSGERELEHATFAKRQMSMLL